VARPGREGTPNFVEGLSEQGGRAGFVEVELHRTMVDFALFVFAHELGPTPWARPTSTTMPVSHDSRRLAEPDAEPRFPQRFVEVMAHGRPVAPGMTAPG